MLLQFLKCSSWFTFQSAVVFLKLILILSVTTVDSAPAKIQLTHVSWGDGCRLRNKGDPPLKPGEKCNEAVGIFCQKYAQGSFCGCRLESSDLSYDARSGECRLMVGEYCQNLDATKDAEGYYRQGYSSKCHENAECIQVGSWADQRLGDPVCQCKSGYINSHDMTKCVDPNHPNWETNRANATNLSYFVTLLAVLFSQLELNRNIK